MSSSGANYISAYSNVTVLTSTWFYFYTKQLRYLFEGEKISGLTHGTLNRFDWIFKAIL